jgi:hypothetical protein
MKKVFSKTEDVVRRWAAQSQAEARTGSNTRFQGRSLFSYGTCVASIESTINGPACVLLSNEHYSSTTAVVIGQARHYAQEGGYRIFRVGHCHERRDRHSENLQHYEKRVGWALDSVEKATKPQKHRDLATELIDEAARYAAAFGLSWTYAGPAPADVLSRKERAERS